MLTMFEGITDVSERKQRMRRAIKDRGLEGEAVGANQRRPVTWSAAFERLYGEPL